MNHAIPSQAHHNLDSPAHQCLCPRGSLRPAHRGGISAEEEVVEEEPTPEEVPAPEIEPEPEVTPEEPEVEPAPEVTPEEPDVEPEPETVPPPPADDCDETSDLLYAVDKGNGGLYLFDPLTGAFRALGDTRLRHVLRNPCVDGSSPRWRGLCSLLKLNTLCCRSPNPPLR